MLDIRMSGEKSGGKPRVVIERSVSYGLLMSNEKRCGTTNVCIERSASYGLLMISARGSARQTDVPIKSGSCKGKSLDAGLSLTRNESDSAYTSANGMLGRKR
jgi:hypothetical protein